eukprot:gene18339-9176_t
MAASALQADMFSKEGRVWNNRGGKVHLGNWQEERYLAENLEEKTDHNNPDISLTKTYKHGHEGITARGGATGSNVPTTSTARGDFGNPAAMPQYNRYTGDRAARRAQQAREQAIAEVQAIEDAGYAASQSFDKRSTAKASYTADGTFVSSDPDAGKAPLGNMMPAGSGKITGMTTTVTAMGTPFALSSNFSKPLDEEVDCVSKN